MTKQAIDLKRGMKSNKNMSKTGQTNEDQKMLVYKDGSDDEAMNEQESENEDSYGSGDESGEEIKQIALKEASAKKRPRNLDGD